MMMSPLDCGDQVVLLAGDHDVRDVMRDGVARAELLGAASDHLEALERARSHVAEVVDDFGREDLLEPVELASVEYVSV